MVWGCCLTRPADSTVVWTDWVMVSGRTTRWISSILPLIQPSIRSPSCSMRVSPGNSLILLRMVKRRMRKMQTLNMWSLVCVWPNIWAWALAWFLLPTLDIIMPIHRPSTWMKTTQRPRQQILTLAMVACTRCTWGRDGHPSRDSLWVPISLIYGGSWTVRSWTATMTSRLIPFQSFIRHR